MSNGSEAAYSRPGFFNPRGEYEWGAEGLTKREYFAAMVMANVAECWMPGHERAAANHAVLCADALLAELEKQPPSSQKEVNG